MSDGHEQADAAGAADAGADGAGAGGGWRNEIVEASAGGGMVTVKATGGGEIVEIRIDPRRSTRRPELLADLVLAAVNEALRSAQALAESKLGGSLGGLGLPGLLGLALPDRLRPDRHPGHLVALEGRGGQAGGRERLQDPGLLGHGLAALLVAHRLIARMPSSVRATSVPRPP